MKSFLLYCGLFAALTACQQQPTALFKEVPMAQSQIKFNNEIKETDQINVINYEYLYNGGGVGIGDFNNDSLPDIYFTGNLVPNKMYMNRGQMRFEDVTDIAGVAGHQKWCKGATVVDINNDGMLDIYVSASVKKAAKERENLLYVCQRIDTVLQIPIYKEMAAVYGLADTSSAQMANFFDYDNDGDLDVYLLVNETTEGFPNAFRPVKKDGSSRTTDRLLRNDWNETLHHPVFTNVSKQAGILLEGYGLGVSICDLNKDGWKDIYVSNDYISNNILYINNRDGTFTDRCAAYFKHSSRNAMGNDIADLNNDGLADVFELDMAPTDNQRLKMMNNTINYATFQNTEKLGYMHQYVRNTLQLNQGNRPLQNDSTGEPIFSETGYSSGIAQTDWSWATLLIDVDNDGWRDVLISNGLPKDMTDLDFMAYRDEAKNRTPLAEVLKQLPTVKIPNFIYRNNQDATFTNKTMEWGWLKPTFSAGMAYADLDGDGDLDIVLNNTNMPASLLENTSINDKNDSSHFLQIQFDGDSLNVHGIGVDVSIFCKGQMQAGTNNPYRGYLSSCENIMHFGLGKNTNIDSIIVYWSPNKKQVITDVAANQRMLVHYRNATDFTNTAINHTNSLFTDITLQNGIHFFAAESDFIDFSIQRLMPHKLSQYGPSLAAADVNGDGLDDLLIGGSSPYYAQLFLQQINGQFAQKNLPQNTYKKLADDAGICLFDADGDKDLDLYIAQGGFENSPLSPAYADLFYKNDGHGNFSIDSKALPTNNSSKSCVKAADYDQDGDLDLFVGGRVLPGSYPLPVSSFIYQNDGKGNFTDVTKMIAPALAEIGLVCDAVWSDVDNDDDLDLLLAGEWMPMTVFKNEKGKLQKTTHDLSNQIGWFNSITPADIDNDGDIDYLLGNYGNNGFYQPSDSFPITIYGKDFDKNESFDALLSNWLPPTFNAPKKEFPAVGRDELIKEMPLMKGRFGRYGAFAKTEMKDVFTKAEMQNAYQQKANLSQTGWVENKGNCQFAWHALPAATQWSPVFGMTVNDFDADGQLDIAMIGNDFGMAPYLGRNDALNGIVLKGDGKGNFKKQNLLESGFFVPGDGKALVQLIVHRQLQLAASQNKGQLKMFAHHQTDSIIRVLPDDMYASYTLKNGQQRKEEFYFGSSFLSQSARFVLLTNAVASVTITNNKKEKRSITLH